MSRSADSARRLRDIRVHYDNDSCLDLLTANGIVSIIEAQAKSTIRPLKLLTALSHLGTGVSSCVAKSREASRERRQRGDPPWRPLTTTRSGRFIARRRPGAPVITTSDKNHWFDYVGRARLGRPGQTGPKGPALRDQIGARLEVIRKSGGPLWRRARSDGSYASANDPRVLVGLGSATEPVRLRVSWPRGRTEEFGEVPVDRWTTLTEGPARPHRRR